MKMKSLIAGVWIFLALLAGPIPSSRAAITMGTAFNYQGSLRNDGAPVNGALAMTFKVYDQAAGGNAALGVVTLPSVAVVDGVFTATLDFGSAIFDGSARWLGVTIGGDAELSPRVPLTPAPYALFAAAAGRAETAAKADDADKLGGQPPSAYASASGGAIAGAVSMSGNPITDIGADGTDFTATGGLNLADGLTVAAGGANIAGGLTVPQALNAGDFGLSALGPLYMNDNIIVGIGNQATSFTSAGGLTLGAGLTIYSGGANISGGLTVPQALNAGDFGVSVLGPLYMNDNILVGIGNQSTSFSSTGGLTLADGLTIYKGGVNVTGGATIAGTTTLNGSLNMNGGSLLGLGSGGTYFNALGALYVGANLTVAQDVTVSGEVTATGDIFTSGDVVVANAYQAAGSAERLRIVRGSVNANGTVAGGSGFTVSFHSGSVPRYTVNFNAAFADTPVLTATPRGGGGISMVIGGESPSAIDLTPYDVISNSAAPVNGGFMFIAIGRR